jgi:DNA repair protein RadA/Sms
LVGLAKEKGFAIILVGHVTKEGAIAGPKLLEHMVDTVLYFEGEKGHPFRILRAVKNRFGPTSEIGVFEMRGDGLHEVKSPSALFLAERRKESPGSVVIAAIEGTRPLLLEVQALVSTSILANPRRTAIGADAMRLALLVAVMEKVFGVVLHDKDIFLNVAGGLSVSEPAADLGIVASIYSSVANLPVAEDTVVIGEVGLGGEVRAVSACEIRVREAKKMGFKRAIVPAGNIKSLSGCGIDVIGVKRADEAFKGLF